jgi:hypothetical protein
MINAGNKFLIEFCHSMARAQQPQLDGEIVVTVRFGQKNMIRPGRIKNKEFWPLF